METSSNHELQSRDMAICTPKHANVHSHATDRTNTLFFTQMIYIAIVRGFVYNTTYWL